MNFFKDFLAGMKLFGSSLSILVNVVLLSIVYIIGVGVVKIFLQRSLLPMGKRKKTYWRSINIDKKDIENHYRQF